MNGELTNCGRFCVDPQEYFAAEGDVAQDRMGETAKAVADALCPAPEPRENGAEDDDQDTVNDVANIFRVRFRG
jgi:hypothetical protein